MDISSFVESAAAHDLEGPFRMEPSQRDHLTLLLKVNTVLSSARSVEEVMAGLIAQVITTLGAQRGFVVVRQDGDWQALATHYVDPATEQPDLRFSRTLVEKVVSDGAPLRTVDALNDSQFGCPTSISLQSIRSVLCAPLRWSGQVQGVVYADHNVKVGVFTAEQLEVLSAIADQASRALEMSALQEQLQRVHRHSLRAGRTHPSEQSESLAGAAALQFALSSLEGAPPQPCDASELTPSKGLAISLFGPFRVAVEGAPVEDWSTRKNRDLLAYLALHRGQVVHEEKLMDLFWSQGGKKGLHSLHNSITQIRKSLGDSRRAVVVRKLDGYVLGPGCWIDVEEFSRAFAQGRSAARQGRWEEALSHLGTAEALAGGEFLEGCYCDWTMPDRQRLGEQLVQCRTLLAEHFSRHGKHLVAVELWKRVLTHDNCSEEAYRGLIEAHRALGRQADVVRVYQACVKAFHDELQLPPPDEVKALFEEQ
jgi:DNA-binding SARP family transcriptional activator